VKLRRSLIAMAAALAAAACGAPAPQEDWPPPSPALWLVENGNGEREGWLFGTIHALPGGVQWRTAELQSALDQSDALALEISPQDQGNTSAIFSKLGTTPSLPPLSKRIDAAYRDDLTGLLGKTDYSDDDFSSVETWAAALTLAAAASSGDYSNGVDRALGQEFENVLILEGALAQLSIFDNLPEEEQADLLEAIIAESAGQDKNGKRDLARAWLAGDMESIAREADKGMLADAELRDALLIQRNLEWAGTIDQWLKEKGLILVAVGAAHMTGDDGLPALMRQRGYTVTRIQ